ncbi:TetR/AcrR family transcriptional regulator [Bacillus sp. JCM 19034]|uniref:TetR/AcrR family transcriptional regulator n=1 Tax=Bacillus sp. JCM 19034 TaxID=1481928 RepID=UPI0007850247|nr:TetR/AcrR family transcriptional regulator [Bacillus sp. JCM 19034]
MSPRKRASEELTIDTILQIARKQFVKNGYQHVSMRSIANELNCTHGALYYHVKNKAELFYMIVESDFTRLNTIVENVMEEEGDNRDKLMNLFLSIIKFGLDHQSEFEVMFTIRHNEVDSLTHQSAHLCYQTFSKAVHQLIDDHTLHLQEVYATFIALQGFIIHQHRYVNNFAEAEDAALSYVKFVVRGLIGVD